MGERPAKRGRRGPGPSYEPDVLVEPEDVPTSLAGDSLVLAVFKEATKLLNERHDKHEKLVKLSRDITIESKRIIFLLHSADKKEDNQKVLTTAKERIDKLIAGPLKKIGLEHEDTAPYLHHKIITIGLQEFVEARTLYSIISTGTLISHAEVQKELEYVVTAKDEPRNVVTLLPHTDYMLGLADLTGELMRRAVNSVSSGDKEDVRLSYQIVRELYTGFLGLSGSGGPLLSRKLPTTSSNVNKVEMAMYGLYLRDKFGKPTAIMHHPIAEDEDGDDGYY